MAFPSFVRRAVHAGARLVLAVLAGASVGGAQQPRTPPDTVPAAVFVTWNGDPTTTVSVDWHLVAATDIPAVEVRGPGLSAWRRYEGSAMAFPFSSRTVRRAQIDGLRPGSVYELRFAGSRIYKYRTMPARLTRPVRFAAGGDTQAGETTFGPMNRIAAARDVDFVLLGGDLAYSNGDPRLVAREEAWYETVTRTLVTRDRRLIPVIAAIGNHEVFSSRDTTEATARMMRETGVRLGDSPYYKALHAHARERQYSVIDVGDYLSLVLLNTAHTAPVQGAQTEWLRDALGQRSTVPYVFPIYHVPGYPSVRAFEGNTSALVREHWSPLFERFGVRVAFENHDHAYKRTVPIKGGRRDSTGVVYIGDGAWGAVPRPIGREHAQPAWYLETAKSTNHAIFVTLNARTARFEMVDTAGVRFDTYRARPRCVEPLACR
ncbi:MAG TPA: metallophosphoesterase [Gemmatimonadaceae bacterium]|nr:metallophosphoesterase [Gemmatimonadaceae bacterium]